MIPSNDSRLRRAVLAGLCSDPSVQTRWVEVCVRGGAVTLSGWVTSNLQKSAVVSAALRVKGVVSVDDAMSVAVPAPEARERGAAAAESRTILSLAGVQAGGASFRARQPDAEASRTQDDGVFRSA